MRIVLDTAALITALRSRKGAAAEVVRMILRGDGVIHLLDYKLVSEYRDVALRPTQTKTMMYTIAEIDKIIDALELIAEPVDVVTSIRPLSVDESDDLVLDVAINGDAEVIVTNNLRHLKAPAERYGIATLTPGEFLDRWRKTE